MPDQSDTRQAVRTRMAELGISQRELSRRTGINQPMLARWLSGARDTSTPTLERVMAALGLGLLPLAENDRDTVNS